MERRNFIKNGLTTGIVGSIGLNHLLLHSANAQNLADLEIPEIVSPEEIKLVVKPIVTNMYHTAEWEGPCRFNVVPTEEEKTRVLNGFGALKKRIDDNEFGILSGTVEMLEPGLTLFVEDFRITDSEWAKIDQDAFRADVLFVNPGGASIAAFYLAQRYNKPVVFTSGLSCRTVDISAYMRSKGYEAFIPNEEAGVNEIFEMLRARKIFRNTKILYPTDWGWPSVASVAGINEPEKLKEMYGIELVRITYAELSDQMNKVIASDKIHEYAQKVGGEIFEGAQRTYLAKEHVNSSILFQCAVKQLMLKHGCNAFTIECFEFCTSRLPQKWNITPCLIHTLFKDAGIPSACEGDLGGLLAMQLLMTVSKKSPHMGNMFYRVKNYLEINHSVPGMKMNGYNKPGLPYQLGRFVESGWGTKAVVDFMDNAEKEVTVARMDPSGTRLLVLRGVLTGSKGWDEDLRGCSVTAYMVGKESGTGFDFAKKQGDYGNHLCWVYGDYSEKLTNLCNILNIDIQIVS